MHALENRVINPASQPPPRLLVSKDYQHVLYHWRIVCLEENGADMELFIGRIVISAGSIDSN